MRVRACYVCASALTVSLEAAEGTESPGAGVSGSCKLPRVGAVPWTARLSLKPIALNVSKHSNSCKDPYHTHTHACYNTHTHRHTRSSARQNTLQLEKAFQNPSDP